MNAVVMNPTSIEITKILFKKEKKKERNHINDEGIKLNSI